MWFWEWIGFSCLTEWMNTAAGGVLRPAFAAITSWLFTLFCGPFFIKKLYEWKIGQPIRMEECPLLGKLHYKKKDTPTMGGVLILSGMFLSAILWMDWSSRYTWVLLLTTLVLALMGGKDDYLKLKFKNSKGMAGRKKLAIQLLIAGGLSALIYQGYLSPPSSPTDPFHEYVIPFVSSPWILTGTAAIVAGGLLNILVVAGTSNAVNLTDGLDGLAGGCICLCAGALAVFAFVESGLNASAHFTMPYVPAASEVLVYLAAMVGGCLGFLWYNAHPAQVFMGDIGSLTLGGGLGVSAILIRQEFLLVIVGGIFVLEALSVILQVISFRWRKGKRIFLCSPLHHHFEYLGWAETKVVFRFWVVALLFAVIGLFSLFSHLA